MYTPIPCPSVVPLAPRLCQMGQFTSPLQTAVQPPLIQLILRHLSLSLLAILPKPILHHNNPILIRTRVSNSSILSIKVTLFVYRELALTYLLCTLYIAFEVEPLEKLWISGVRNTTF